MKRVIGFLSTAVFFTTVLLVALAGRAAAQTAPTLDHFYCYFALDRGLKPVTVTLQDQFDVGLNPLIPPAEEKVQDLRIVRFCNPVKKTTADGKVTEILHKDDHLTMYLITPEPIIPRVVIIHNQFGTQQLRTGNAVLLAVPSGKVWPVGTATSAPIPTDLDHFKCYLASGRNIGRRVLLQDQFFKDTKGVLAGVLQPILFCNPVKKVVVNPSTGLSTTTDITHPDAHLACYVTTRRNFQTTLLYEQSVFAATRAIAGIEAGLSVRAVTQAKMG
jgi:hypothetical protein